jgi:hypothetical protein
MNLHSCRYVLQMIWPTFGMSVDLGCQNYEAFDNSIGSRRTPENQYFFLAWESLP